MEAKLPLGRIKITISDPDTGAVLEEKILHDDYAIICCGSRYVKSCQLWGSTVQVNIARQKPGARL